MGNEAKQYIEKRIQYLESNEGLKETKKASYGKLTGQREEGGYSGRSEMLQRRPPAEGGYPTKRVKRD